MSKVKIMDKENESDNEVYFSQKFAKQLASGDENKISECQKVKINDSKLFGDAQVVPDGDEDLFGECDEPEDQIEVVYEIENQNPNPMQNDGSESSEISNCHVTPTISDAENRMKSVPNVKIKEQRKLTARKRKAARVVNKLQFGRLSNKKLDLDLDSDSEGNAQIETAFGVWVECVLCMKWRYLKNVNDPTDIIENWNCSMTSNNTCKAEPEDWTNEIKAKCARNKFVRGSIVWAKFSSIPWWPAIVDNDPDEGRFFRTDGNMTPTEYHVVFWDNKIWRSWIPVMKIQPFGPNGGTRTNTKGTSYYSRRVEAAKILAAEASQMGFKERIENFGFATYVLKGTYFGKQSRKSSAEMDKGNLPKRSRKLSPHVEKGNLRKHSGKPSGKITKTHIGKVTLEAEKDDSDVSSNSPKSQKELTKKEKDDKSENDEETFEILRTKPKFVPQFKRNSSE